MFVFEWRYFVRQPSFYVTSSIFFLLTFFATVSENVQIGGGGNVLYNGPFSIAQTLIIMGIFAMFLVVNFVASTATRNDTSKMAELLYSKPINPISYQLGRFLGSFAVVATVFAFVPLGILIGTVLGGAVGWIDSERLAATNLSYYFSAYFYISIPTLLVMSCFFYALAIRFRSMMAVYLAAVGLFIFYIVSGQFLTDPEYRTIVALADPFAANTFGEVTRYWTMFDKNNSAIELSGVLLQNRMIWLAVAIVIMVVFGGFNRKIAINSKKVKKAKENQDDELVSQVMDNNIHYQSKGITTLAHMVLRIKFEIKQVIFSAPFIVLGLFTIFTLVAPLLDPQGMYGAPNWPVTQNMVELIRNSTELFMIIVLAYYSAEIVWRERNSGMGDIIDSMPVNSITFWLSKILSITLVLTLLYAIGMLVTISNQYLSGYSNIELSQYIVRLGYASLLPFFMTAVLAFLLQVLSPNKYIGMLLFVLYFISTITLSNFGFSHNLYQFSRAPQLLFSDINGYGHFFESRHWYMAYWLGFTIVFSALTYALWHRGPAQPLRVRLKKVGYYLGLPGKAAVAFGIVLAIFTGFNIHHNTRVLNEYVIEDDREALQADYEKAYVSYLNDEIPTITKTHAYVDIFPKERRIEAMAEITVVNKSDKAIDRFMVTKPRFSELWQVNIAGGEIGEVDEKFNLAWFTFSQPLQPGESRHGTIKVVRAHNGFSDGNNDFTLLHNGTFINNYELFPAFGYQSNLQLQDRHKRRKYGLEPIQRANKLEDERFYNESFFGKGIGFIDFEATISTSEDQFAIAPGYLQTEKVENGRRTYHYKMDAPMVNFYSIMSAKLLNKKESYKGIDIEIYYHKDHGMNVDRMIESVRDSIDYFNENFGPYQHKQLRIIEFPGYRSFAQSFANTVPYSEKIGFITDLRDKENIDPVYYVTAHEVAHQWWGHQVGAANVQGSAIISESLSQYSALMVMETKYGKDKIRNFLKYELDRYLRGRSVEVLEEMPLMRSEGQQYIHYQKGSVVMMAIKDRFGEERLNQLLKQFLTEFKYNSTPYPTTLDLMAHLLNGANEQEREFISSLFEYISIYDLKTADVVTEQRADGKYELTITIDAKLMRADGDGQETEIDFKDNVDIGLFSDDPSSLTASNHVMYLQKHSIKTGTNTVVVVVDELPKYVGVDPFVRMVDRDSEDNIFRL